MFKSYHQFEIPKQPHRFWFFIARVFGRKLTPWSYYWRGSYWIMADAPLNVPLSESNDQEGK